MKNLLLCLALLLTVCSAEAFLFLHTQCSVFEPASLFHSTTKLTPSKKLKIFSLADFN